MKTVNKKVVGDLNIENKSAGAGQFKQLIIDEYGDVYSETLDTLDSVVNRGNQTGNSVAFGKNTDVIGTVDIKTEETNIPLSREELHQEQGNHVYVDRGIYSESFSASSGNQQSSFVLIQLPNNARVAIRYTMVFQLIGSDNVNVYQGVASCISNSKGTVSVMNKVNYYEYEGIGNFSFEVISHSKGTALTFQINNANNTVSVVGDYQVIVQHP